VRLLLDTHVLVWLVEGMAQLRPAARRTIERAAATDGVVVSAISFWEVAMLAVRGRLALGTPPSIWRRRVLELTGLVEEPIDGEIGIEAVQLPGSLHADPADRLLTATARLRGHRLVTQDARLIAYGREGHVGVLAL
jgi:PIN domain nuclease of toxin-antitoxin system